MTEICQDPLFYLTVIYKNSENFLVRCVGCYIFAPFLGQGHLNH